MKSKPDRERRQKQASRIVRILRVHKLSKAKTISEVEKQEIAQVVGVNIRTVHRDLATLRLLYETLGTTLLD